MRFDGSRNPSCPEETLASVLWGARLPINRSSKQKVSSTYIDLPSRTTPWEAVTFFCDDLAEVTVAATKEESEDGSMGNASGTPPF